MSAGPAPGSVSPAPARGGVLSLVAVITSVFISTLTLAIITPLLAARLAAEGVSGSWIGLNAGAGAAAILLVTMITPWLGRRLGSFQALMVSIVVMAVGVGLLPIFHSLGGWFALRFLIGAGIAVHWVISEVWINTAAEEADRGKVVGLYVAAMGLAYCVGYPLLFFIGTEGDVPFILVTAMIVAAGLPILLARRVVPALPPVITGGTLDAMKREPIVMAASLVAGFAIAVVLSFLLIYVQRVGLSGRAALAVLSTVAIGNVLLQVPIGMLVDRGGAEKLLIAVSLVGLAGLALLPFLGPMGVLRWPFLFFWGGSLGGVYTLALTLVGRRFRHDELPGANAAFVIVYQVGGLLGPIVSGAGLDLWNPHGVFAALGLVYVLFIMGCLTAQILRRRPAVAGV